MHGKTQNPKFGALDAVLTFNDGGTGWARVWVKLGVEEVKILRESWENFTLYVLWKPKKVQITLLNRPEWEGDN